jgi:predicted AlkP superfamily phosphohydrolase/phosphomutase
MHNKWYTKMSDTQFHNEWYTISQWVIHNFTMSDTQFHNEWYTISQWVIHNEWHTIMSGTQWVKHNFMSDTQRQ